MALNLKNSFPLTTNKVAPARWDVTAEAGGGGFHDAVLTFGASFSVTYTGITPPGDVTNPYSFEGALEGPDGVLFETQFHCPSSSMSGSIQGTSPYRSGSISCFVKVHNLGNGQEFLRVNAQNITSCSVSGSWFPVEASNVKISSHNVNDAITISWDAVHQTMFEIVVKQKNDIKFARIGSQERSVTIPAGILLDDGMSVYLEVGNGTGVGGYGVATSVTTHFAAANPNPVVENLRPVGEQDGSREITVSWQANYQTGFFLEVRWNGQLAYRFSGTTARSVALPARALYDGRVELRLEVVHSYEGALYKKLVSGFFTVTRNPVVSVDLLRPDEVTKNGLDEIRVTWESENQKAWTLRVFHEGRLVETYRGTTERQRLLPKRLLFSGSISLELTAENRAYGALYTASATSRFAVNNHPAIFAAFTEPVQNARMNGKHELRIAWESVRQEAFRVEVLREGKILQTFSGTTEKEVLLAPSVLYDAEAAVVLTVSNMTYGAPLSYEAQCTITIVNNPVIKILSLEPNHVDQHEKFELAITWASVNQEAFSLVLKDEKGSVLRSFAGGSQRTVVLPKKALPRGMVQMFLTVTNHIYDTLHSASKQAQFEVYGKPLLPVWTVDSVLGIGLPTLAWTSVGQSAFHLEIYEGEVLREFADWTVSKERSYTVQNPMESGKSYDLWLEIRDKRGLKSGVVKKTVQVDYAQLPKPELAATADRIAYSVILRGQMLPSDRFVSAQLHRSMDGGRTWVRLAYDLPFAFVYEDRTAGMQKALYRMVALDKGGGVTMSDPLAAGVPVQGFSLMDVESLERVDLGWNAQVQWSHKTDTALEIFLGQQEPSVTKGVTSYASGRFGFAVDLATSLALQRMQRAKVLLYRDFRGERIFCSMSSEVSEEYDHPGFYRVAFDLTQISYQDRDVFAGRTGVLHLIFFDGTWLWNGDRDFSGVRWVVDEED